MVLWGKGREMTDHGEGDHDGETVIVLELDCKDARNGDAAVLPVFCSTNPKHNLRPSQTALTDRCMMLLPTQV